LTISDTEITYISIALKINNTDKIKTLKRVCVKNMCNIAKLAYTVKHCKCCAINRTYVWSVGESLT